MAEVTSETFGDTLFGELSSSKMPVHHTMLSHSGHDRGLTLKRFRFSMSCLWGKKGWGKEMRFAREGE